MKKILSFLLVLFAAANLSLAQGFEGKIDFSLKVEGSAAAMMASMMPTGYQYYIKDRLMKMKMEGGMAAAMFGEIVVNGETGESYMLQHSKKTAFKMPVDQEAEDEDSAEEGSLNIEKMDGEMDILGYKCQKYRMIIQGEAGQNIPQIVWVTDKIRVAKPKGSVAGMSQFALDGIDGFPLMIEAEMGQGIKMIITATNIEKRKFADAEFEVPEGYQVKDFDINSLFGR